MPFITQRFCQGQAVIEKIPISVGKQNDFQNILIFILSHAVNNSRFLLSADITPHILTLFAQSEVYQQHGFV